MPPGGRLVFIKDTCCDYELIRRRLEAAKDTPMKLFNANCQSWYDSYCHGAGGYSGIMANFHPDIYKYCVTHKDTDPEKVQRRERFSDPRGHDRAHLLPGELQILSSARRRPHVHLPPQRRSAPAG